MAEQDVATVYGWGYVSGLTSDKAEELVRLIPTLNTDTWGSDGEHAPRIESDGRVRVAMKYGPVLGAWPDDLRKKLQAAADKVRPGATVEVDGTVRKVKETRAEYDRRQRDGDPPQMPTGTSPPEDDEDDRYDAMTPDEKALWDGDVARHERELAERKVRFQPLHDEQRKRDEEYKRRQRDRQAEEPTP
jgi:hypothetical protein